MIAYRPRAAEHELSGVALEIQGISGNKAQRVEESIQRSVNRKLYRTISHMFMGANDLTYFSRVVAQCADKPVCVAVIGRVCEAIHGEQEAPPTIAVVVYVETFRLR